MIKRETNKYVLQEWIHRVDCVCSVSEEGEGRKEKEVDGGVQESFYYFFVQLE
jgi:hypothetical protein